MRQVFAHLAEQPFLRRFYLAGGTAVALRLGHRRSHDLDFFSEADEVLEDTRRAATASLQPFRPAVIEDVGGNLLLELEGLHVAFLSYGYPLVGTAEELEGVAVASLTDLGLMKLDALISRGSRKDFYDLYFILRHLDLASLLAQAEAKYPYAQDFELMAVESLVQFGNADRDEQPELLVDLPWSTVRAEFQRLARKLGETWWQ
jgi:predicted nucleotidyltransferase component of viral defense system